MKTLTVFTPTFNRAFCIQNLYESLVNQTCQDFEWLIIDDGSTDESKNLIDSWINENKIDIKYIFQQNQGMHGAHNTAYKNIKTELNTCIDSDDFMTIDAVKNILECWNSISNKYIYAGLIGLDVDKEFKIIGTKFKDNLLETTLSGFYKNGGTGDKKVVYRTEIINKYPEYPIFEGEKYVSLGYKYLLIDQDYKLFVLNKPLVVVEYLKSGSTLNMLNQYKKNPKGFAFIRIVNIKFATSFFEIFKQSVHYVSSCIFAKNSNFLREASYKFLTFSAIPFGLLLYFYIKFKTNKIIK